MSTPITTPAVTVRPVTLRAPLYHVVLLNDDEHTFDYVIGMLCRLFGHSAQMAHQMAREVHRTGRVIVATVHKEAAELKQEEIHGFGPDRLVPFCKGSMSAILEPAICAGRN